MFNTESTGYSLSDIAAASGANRTDGFGDGNNGWWIILLFLFLFAGGYNRNGFGSSSTTSSTSSGITDGYVLTSDFANIERKIDGVNNGLCDGFYTNAQLINGVNQNINTAGQSILSQMANDNMSRMSDNYAIQTQMNNNTNSINQGLTAIGTQMSAGFCENRNQLTQDFAQLNYNLAQQNCQTRQAVNDATAAITANQDANTRSILDFLTNDKIATLTAENQSLKFAASQQAQNAYLVSALSPHPQPAYVVPNPYTGTTYTYGCSCNG